MAWGQRLPSLRIVGCGYCCDRSHPASDSFVRTATNPIVAVKGMGKVSFFPRCIRQPTGSL
jgi:hypothetical protein